MEPRRRESTYIQIKKVGGGGTSKADEICTHAAKYATTLRQQMNLYRPHLVLGCGVGRDSPARLFRVTAMPNDDASERSERARRTE